MWAQKRVQVNPIWIHDLAFFFKAADICSAFRISDWSVSGRCHYTHDEYTNVFKFYILMDITQI